MVTWNKKRLLAEISNTLDKKKAVKLAKVATNDNILMDDLLEICYHADKQIAFRASWVLEFAESNCPERFTPILQTFLQRLPCQKNQSCRRHFTKILMRYTAPKAKTLRKAAFAKMPDEVRERILETVFEWLIDTTTPVAVQVNCMDVLFYLIPWYPWIKDELANQVAFYLKTGSPAMQSRGRRLLSKIDRIPTS